MMLAEKTHKNYSQQHQQHKMKANDWWREDDFMRDDKQTVLPVSHTTTKCEINKDVSQSLKTEATQEVNADTQQLNSVTVGSNWWFSDPFMKPVDCLIVDDDDVSSDDDGYTVCWHREYAFNVEVALDRLETFEYICDNSVDLSFDIIKTMNPMPFDTGSIVLLPCIFYNMCKLGYSQRRCYSTLFTSHILLWPVNYEHMHWALFVVRNLSKVTDSECDIVVEYYDSQGPGLTKGKRFKEQLQTMNA